jgi:tRNA(Ile)-lysidine synthase
MFKKSQSLIDKQVLSEDWSAYGWTERGAVVAVSGGADSVALLRVLGMLEDNRPERLIVAHFDHRLRARSADDARFVADLAHRLALPFELGQADVAALAEEQGDGIEAAARHARYRFLEDVADRHRAHFVLTGHTADDQAETVLHRILRGTGVAGLRGIQGMRSLFGRQDIYLVRPLLRFRHQELVALLNHLEQPYCEDPTNADPRFMRNRIRHQLLPILERDFNVQIVDALLRLSETASGSQSAIDEMVDDLVEEAVAFEDEAVIVRRDVLAGINFHLICEVFVRIWRDMGWPRQQMGLDEWTELAFHGAAVFNSDESPEIAEAHDEEPYKRMFPGRIVVEKVDGDLILKRHRKRAERDAGE